jgi:hypothetical protein
MAASEIFDQCNGKYLCTAKILAFVQGMKGAIHTGPILWTSYFDIITHCATSIPADRWVFLALLL